MLKRPRWLRGGLIRALRNAKASRYRTAMRRPSTVPLLESHLPGSLLRFIVAVGKVERTFDVFQVKAIYWPIARRWTANHDAGHVNRRPPS